MDFNQIRYFLALAETLNFTRAAEQSHVSQPALTQAIKRLETELGGELIRRDNRYTELTELGKLLQGYFQKINHTRQLVHTTAKAVTAGEIAELNIGIMCTIGPRELTGMLDTFRAQHPMVSLILHDVAPSSISELLLSGALDGAFCAHRNETSHSRLRRIDLHQEAMVVAFPPDHAFAQKDAVSLREIAGQKYVDRLHCEFRQDFLDFFEDENLQLDVVLRSDRDDWIQNVIRDGMGVTVIPQFSLLPPELDYRPIKEPALYRKVEFAVVDQPRATTALEMFVKQVNIYDWSGNKPS